MNSQTHLLERNKLGTDIESPTGIMYDARQYNVELCQLGWRDLKRRSEADCVFQKQSPVYFFSWQGDGNYHHQPIPLRLRQSIESQPRQRVELQPRQTV